MRKWLLVLIGFLINICMGAIYSFSVFRKPLEKMWGISAAQSGLPFMVFLAFFALTMAVAGGLIRKWGPRRTSLLGSILVGLGWVGAGFSQNIELLTLLYGVIGGAGVGIVYGCPISVAAAWFPRRSGLAIGLTVMGFGLSGLVMAPLMDWLIRTVGPLQTFFYLGITFLAVLTMLSLPLRFPKQGEINEVVSVATVGIETGVDMRRSQMVRTMGFYALWSTYTIGCMAGLMAIGIASPFGKEVVKLDDTMTAFSISLFSVFNGIGRPLFGMVTDRFGPRKSVLMSFGLVLASFLALYFLGEGNPLVYLVSFGILWLNLGGWLAMAPTITKIFFGAKYYSENYGLVFTAYGAGAIIGTSMSGIIRDLTGTYLSVFPVTTALTILGLIIAIFGLKPTFRNRL
ncbi:MAG: OFA family MFS transporter [Thermoproteota archaeon]|nr:OFA family MFS transporter [Candidatus Brockarchaeota archaeon]